jgi:hypothetical protein
LATGAGAAGRTGCCTAGAAGRIGCCIAGAAGAARVGATGAGPVGRTGVGRTGCGAAGWIGFAGAACGTCGRAGAAGAGVLFLSSSSWLAGLACARTKRPSAGAADTAIWLPTNDGTTITVVNSLFRFFIVGSLTAGGRSTPDGRRDIVRKPNISTD